MIKLKFDALPYLKGLLPEYFSGNVVVCFRIAICKKTGTHGFGAGVVKNRKDTDTGRSYDGFCFQ